MLHVLAKERYDIGFTWLIHELLSISHENHSIINHHRRGARVSISHRRGSLCAEIIFKAFVVLVSSAQLAVIFIYATALERRVYGIAASGSDNFFKTEWKIITRFPSLSLFPSFSLCTQIYKLHIKLHLRVIITAIIMLR